MSARADHELRLLRPLRWRDGQEGLVELHDPTRDEWARLLPWTRGVLEGLGAGEDLATLLKRAGDAPEARVRRFLQTLARVGYLEVVVPPPTGIPARYEILRELGRGGTGIAYEAKDAQKGERVVLKRPWGFLHPIEAVTAALRREAEVLSALDHEGIVAFRDTFEADGHTHLVRAFVDGVTLTQRFEAAPASPAEAWRVADGLCAAVSHMHARGFLLVDHKPSNVHLVGGRVVLVDVGNAERAGPDGAQLQGIRGTRSFLPPEMRARRFVDARSDVWGIGRMVAFALTGRLFRGEEPSLDAVAQGLEGLQKTLVEILCADDPAARPASVEAARALAREALAR